MVVLFKAGDHIPEMPLVDDIGNGANTVPEQIAAIPENDGVTLGETVIVRVVVVAHCPAMGVNV